MGTEAGEMNFLRSTLHGNVRFAALLVSLAVSAAQTPTPAARAPGAAKQTASTARKTYPQALIQSGRDLFRQDCSFCHGRDAGGGETGPDLTRSKLVAQDVDGDKIGPVVLNGRPDKGMPRFDRSEQQIASLAAFIHIQQYNALTRKGGRKGVDVADLQ